MYSTHKAISLSTQKHDAVLASIRVEMLRRIHVTVLGRWCWLRDDSTVSSLSSTSRWDRLSRIRRKCPATSGYWQSGSANDCRSSSSIADVTFSTNWRLHNKMLSTDGATNEHIGLMAAIEIPPPYNLMSQLFAVHLFMVANGVVSVQKTWQIRV